MRCTRCGVCCKETDMLLSTKDIELIVKQGFNAEFFVRLDGHGYTFLRNHQGYCVFYNVQEKRCNVYSYRPIGCRVYPVIYDEEKGIVVDSICCAQETVTETEKLETGKRVVKILEKIDKEVKERHSQ